MARGKDRVPGFASFNTFFDEPGAVDWDKVETAVGAIFDKRSREEIVTCAIEYSASLEMQAQAPALEDLTNLITELRKVASETVRLNDAVSAWVHPDDRTEDNTRKASAFTVLSLAYSDDVYLRASLAEMAVAGQAIMRCLEADPSFSLEKRALKPETAALAAFIGEALKGATKRPARGNHTWTKTEGYEFERWCISIGPQSSQTLAFCRTLLSDDITASLLKTAFEEMRRNLNPEHPHFSALAKEM